MSARLVTPPRDGAILLCTGRGSHDPFIMALEDSSMPWTPARRTGGAHEYRCRECGRSWRLGARRFRALSEAVGRGELAGQIDLSELT